MPLETPYPPAEQQQTPSSNLPSDHGLPALGLVMQCAGGLFAILSGYAIVGAIMARGEGMWLFVIGAASVARSLVHRGAGVAVTYGPGERARSMLNTYYIVAAVHTVVCLFALDKLHMPSSLVALGALLLAWPAALAIVTTRPSIRAVLSADQVPPPSDLGYEGLGILMTILSCFALIFMAIFDYFLFSSKALTAQVEGMVLLLVAVLLTIRSVVHIRAGLKGISPRDFDGFNTAANGYATFGIAAAVIAAALFLFITLRGFSFEVLLIIVMVMGSLLIWPLAVKRYLTEKSFARIMNDNPPPLSRAADGGLTALGWILLAFGSFAIAYNIPMLFIDGGGVNSLVPMGLAGGEGSSEKTQLMMSVAVGALELWAGIELAFMTARWKIAGLVYGGIATAIALYNILPVMKALDTMKEFGRSSSPLPLGVFAVATVLVALVLPLSAIILSLRKGFTAADRAASA